jgi:SAM-dependent methyltransferase
MGIFNSKIRLDKKFLQFDISKIRRTVNLRLVPNLSYRYGGKTSYGEWCHVIGIFQTLFYSHLPRKTDNCILDAGCGTGILAIACEPFLGKKGKYIGIDIQQRAINFCQQHYPKDKFSFQHIDASNPLYTPEVNKKRQSWQLPEKSVDMVTALSVWTHFSEEDARFYFMEINKILKPGGLAIITFFLLDETYSETLPLRVDQLGRYHRTNQLNWIFDQPCEGSSDWFHHQKAKIPEAAIGVTVKGVKELIEPTRLKWVKLYVGNWKEVPGPFFQDILVFQA